MTIIVQSQTITLEGTVIDADTRQTLPYATVHNSQGGGTICNENGAFKIECLPDAVLTISYVGYRKTQVKAADIGPTVKLKPVGRTLNEVVVMPEGERLERIIKAARRQLKEHKKEWANFFYRQTLAVDDAPCSLTEAFFTAKSAMMLRDMDLLTGRYTSVKGSGSYPGNFFYLSQLGMLPESGDYGPSWARLLPLHENYADYYDVKIDIEGDCYLLSFKPKANIRRPIVSCTLFVDIETLMLRKAVGSVKNLEITFDMLSRHVQRIVSNNLFTIHYTSTRGFCEVQSAVFDVSYATHLTIWHEAHDYQFHALLFNVGQQPIEGTRSLGSIVDLRTQIDKVTFNRQFWDQHETVKRTQIESELDQGQTATKNNLVRWADRIDQFNAKFPQEKVYVHMDNTAYFMGETIWFKAYVMRADNQKKTTLSRVLYVDLVSPDGEVVQTLKLPIVNGEAASSFQLEKLIQSGFYEVRAYTRYMTNWDGATAFSRVIPIFKKPARDGDYAKAVIDKTDYRRRLPNYREQVEKQPSAKGGLKVGLYPEGGQLVEQVPCRVAFEVTDEQGRAVDVTARLLQNGQPIDTVKTLYEGRGRFSLTPTFEPATLAVSRGDGREYSFVLPKAVSSGAVLTVNTLTDNVIRVKVSATPNLYGKSFGLAVMGRGNVTHFTPVPITGLQDAIAFDRADMDDGVNHMVLFDNDGTVVASRLFFVYPKQRIDSIQFSAAGQQLRPSQKTSLVATTRPKSIFSMAIRDYDTDKNGPLEQADTWLLLSSELRGYIAHPEYYLEADDRKHRQAVDLLMMVQGWHRYHPQTMMTAKTLDKQQPIEDGLYLFGQLRGYWRQKTRVDSVDLRAILYNSLGDVLSGQTVTDSTGHFVFRMPDCVGSWRTRLKATVGGKPRDFFFNIERQPQLQPRLLYPAEQQYRAIGQPALGVAAADNFDELLPIELRNHLLQEVEVKGRDLRNFWEDETIGARTANLRYDMQEELEKYADGSRKIPNFFEWLQERNEFFSGDNYNIFLEDTVPDMKIQDIKNIPYGDYTKQPHFTWFTQGGWSYKHRPVVWVLNNDFYAVTMLSSSRDTESSVYWLTDQISLMDMPDDLAYIKSVFISEDDSVWKQYVRWGALENRHPVTIYVYSDATPSKAEKGVRNTYFDGYSVDAYNPPGYTELPPIADTRRTLYWNPYVKTDANGHATVEFYNGATTRRVSISAEGITPDGHVLIYKNGQP
ncbi:MAG: carboxypeptidase-like regulatory domain-containing protein [Prevotella sp.]|nr:carboxypeptidase-like regulatory domain-containing protein [Prevotella sp.]